MEEKMTLKQFLEYRKAPLGLKILLWSYAILFIADITTSMLQPTVLKHLETNPLYILTGSMMPVILMNIAVFCAIWLFYPRVSPYGRFMFCNFIVWVSVFRLYAIRNAVRHLLNPPTIQYMQSVTTATKVSVATNVGLTFFMPLVMTFIVYLVFIIDHKIQWRKSQT